MAITTYAELQTSVANWLHRSDLTAIIPDFIALAESRVNGDLDARFQDSIADLVTVAGTSDLVLPSDLINIRSIRVETNPAYVLKYVSPDQWTTGFPDTSSFKPLAYTVIGSDLWLAPTPDDVYSLRMAYKAKIPALSDTNTTNWLLTNYPHVYLYSTLLEAAPYIKDDGRMVLWKEKYDEAIDTVNNQDWYSGSTMYVRTDVS